MKGGETLVFDYLNKKRHFTIKLGQIISHHIVKYGGFDAKLRDPEELNHLDRFELAKTAISMMPPDYLEGDYDKETLTKDTAIYIDKRMLQSFAKWIERDHDRGPAQFKIDANQYGLSYHFEENKKKSRSANGSKSERKKKTENPQVENEKKSIDDQVKESNFVQLKSYLDDSGVFLGSALFRAILFAMNGMTIYNQTKAQAIKKASTYHNVTQKSIKEHIDAMGIVSQRAMDAAKQYKKEYGLQMAGAHSLNKRLERED
ncbi:hypothetical protein AB4672_21755 [Bacillus paralicheniformis]|uniref:hypothetical protein n=1 Tax=Bacillus paralicheniformis TaxID=1648923 RepID=UPI0034D2ABA3